MGIIPGWSPLWSRDQSGDQPLFWSPERYVEEERVVRGGIHAEAAEHLRHRAFMSPFLRDADGFHALVKRLYDSGMLVELDVVRNASACSRSLAPMACSDLSWTRGPRTRRGATRRRFGSPLGRSWHANCNEGGGRRRPRGKGKETH